MRRGAKPRRAKVGAKLPVARKSRENEASRDDLERRLAEALEQLQTRNHELAEAQDQQTATAEILRVISSSPTDLQPMLDTIATNAARACGAYDATVVLREGDFARRVAHHGPTVGSRTDLRPLGHRGFT